MKISICLFLLGVTLAADLALTAYSSQDVIRRGNRIALVLDVEMADKSHVYAPGAKGYKPVSFTTDENPHLEVHGAEFPQPHILDMPEIKEKIPVFEGAFRISQDVTISHEFLETGAFEITGNFVYQACYETVCYEPETIPLSFDLELVAHDLERVPEALRKK